MLILDVAINTEALRSPEWWAGLIGEMVGFAILLWGVWGIAKAVVSWCRRRRGRQE